MLALALWPLWVAVAQALKAQWCEIIYGRSMAREACVKYNDRKCGKQGSGIRGPGHALLTASMPAATSTAES